MGTTKTTKGTRTKLTTSIADLTCIVRLNPNNFNSNSFSFIFDEVLQLEEAPVANPIVHNFSSPLFSDTFEVFHDYLVSVEIGNNVLTNIVVNPLHPTIFSSRQLLEKLPAGTSAFALKLGTQISEFSFNLFDFMRIIKPAVRCDGKIIYSEVNAKNSILQVRVCGINLFGKCEQKETSALLIDSQKALSNIPGKVLLVAVRNSEWNFDSAFDCAYTQDIVLEGSRTRKVISHRTSVDDWLGLGFFDHSTGLLDTSDSKLRWQCLSEMFIDKRMELDVVPNLSPPSLIDAELQTFFIDRNSSDYIRSCIDFDFSGCSDLHNRYKAEQVFKGYEFGGWQFLSAINCGVSLPMTL